jgi:hypothetical protein
MEGFRLENAVVGDYLGCGRAGIGDPDHGHASGKACQNGGRDQEDELRSAHVS